jgi:hypothetical protein
MSSEWWSEPVRVMVGNGTALNVSTNDQAASVLLREWPASEGARLVRAKKAVLRSMERPDDPGTRYSARRAFEAAAREAGILAAPHRTTVAAPGSKSPRWSKKRAR